MWDYAKREYIDKRVGFDDMIHGVATDIGSRPDRVAYAFTKPKGARKAVNTLAPSASLSSPCFDTRYFKGS